MIDWGMEIKNMKELWKLDGWMRRKMGIKIDNKLGFYWKKEKVKLWMMEKEIWKNNGKIW